MSKEFFENNFLNMGENSPAVDDGSPLSLANSLSVEEDNQRTIPTHLVALEKAMMSLFFENTEEYQYPTANNLLDFIHHDASSKALLMNFTRSEIAEYTKYLVKQMASHPILKDSSIASDDSTLEKFGEDCFIQEEISSIKEEARTIPKLRDVSKKR
ncbi:MAG: hypothetical protein H2069_05370 [Legionella sp.]|nr:hypothetical protein [Legionella sp.]